MEELAREEAPVGREEESKQVFLRSGPGQGEIEFDTSDDGFTPNFTKMKDDLDVPAFLRKQMD
jgi:hypothetical protein